MSRTITVETLPASPLLDCGHPTTRDTGIGAGWSTDRQGATRCYPCAEAADREAFAAADAYTGYLSGTEGHALHVTTWTGAHLARVIQHTVSRSGWNRSEVHAWRAVDPSGAYWYGRNGGIGMVTTMRRAKSTSK